MRVRIRWTAAVLAAFLLTVAGTATADRLGGAYRGPYARERNLNPLPARGKGAVVDFRAFWMFWFEHDREAIFARLGLERRSASWFRHPLRAPGPISKRTKSEVVLPTLLAGLTDESPYVRDAASLALGKLGGPEAVPPLAERSRREPDLEVRQDDLLALGLTSRKEVLEPLLTALGHRDERLRPFAALGLALLGDRRAVPELFAACESTWKAHDDETAAILAIALGHLIGEDRVDALAAPLRLNGRETLKVHVCQALGNVVGEQARRWLSSTLRRERGECSAAVALALGRFPDRDVVRVLIGRTLGGSFDRMTRCFARVSLGQVGALLPTSDPMRSHVREELEGTMSQVLKDPYAAMYAALGLGLLGDPRSARPLRAPLELLNHHWFPDENYSAMAMGLALLGDRESAPLLHRILRSRNQHAELRGYAALGLGILGDRTTRRVLLRIARDPDALTRAFALAALGCLVDPAVLPRLPRLFANLHYREEVMVVRQALWSL